MNLILNAKTIAINKAMWYYIYKIINEQLVPRNATFSQYTPKKLNLFVIKYKIIQKIGNATKIRIF